MLPNVALGPSQRESNQRAWTGVTSSRQRRRWVAGNANWYNAKWQNVSWRTGTKGKLKARFAAVRVRIADGPPQRIRDKGQQHLPGDEAWLIGEHRMSGEKKYYLANLPAGTALRTLAATIKARWICEQAHQQLKEELGLDHFEGRSWQGLHRHALMTMIAYAFLQHRRLEEAGRKKESTVRRLNQAYPRCAMPSPISCFDRCLRDARTAEDGSPQESCVNEPAKVVLVSWGAAGARDGGFQVPEGSLEPLAREGWSRRWPAGGWSVVS